MKLRLHVHFAGVAAMALIFGACHIVIGLDEFEKTTGNTGQGGAGGQGGSVAQCGNEECPIGTFCVEGVCCDNPCDGVCESCTTAGSLGECVNYAAGTNPDDACGSVAVCDGGGECASGAAAWHHFAGTLGRQLMHAVAVGSDGASYFVGEATGTFSWPNGGTLGSIMASGERHGYLVKVDPNGTFLWQQQLIGTDAALTGVAVDGDDVYVSGWVDGEGTFGMQGSVPLGQEDIVVAKVSAATGTVAWLKRMGGTAKDFASDITIIAGEGAVFLGWSDGDVIVDANYNHVNSSMTGTNDAGAIKMNPDGSVGWSTWFGGSGTQLLAGVDHRDGMVAVAGATTGKFDPGTGSELLHVGGYDGWVATLNAATGAVGWAASFGADNEDKASDTLIDELGRVWVAGHIGGTASFGDTMLADGGGGAHHEAVLVAYDMTDTTPIVAVHIGQPNSHEEIHSIERTKNGVWVASGSYASNWSLTPETTLTTLDGGREGFVMKLHLDETLSDATWTPVWAHSLGCTGGGENPINAIALGGDNNIFLAASASGDFNWFGSDEMSHGGLDFFVAKLSP